MLPLLGYALFGSSRYVIVGPDAGTTIVLAAVLASLGPAAAPQNVVIAGAIALTVGVLCLLASLLRLGIVANFLSRPILIGFISGISISILVGQIGRVTGVKLASDGLVGPLFEIARRWTEINAASLALAAGLFVMLRLLAARWPALPGPLVAIVLGTALSMLLDLPAQGVAVIGQVPSALPAFSLPWDAHLPLDKLLLGAGAVLLVSFGSGIVTVRSFAARTGERIDANRELIGFGAANIAAGLFGGLPVTASDFAHRREPVDGRQEPARRRGRRTVADARGGLSERAAEPGAQCRARRRAGFRRNLADRCRRLCQAVAHQQGRVPVRGDRHGRRDRPRRAAKASSSPLRPPSSTCWSRVSRPMMPCSAASPGGRAFSSCTVMPMRGRSRA